MATGDHVRLAMYFSAYKGTVRSQQDGGDDVLLGDYGVGYCWLGRMCNGRRPMKKRYKINHAKMMNLQCTRALK